MDISTLNLIIGGLIGVVGSLCGTIVAGFFNRSNLKLQLFAAQSFEEKKITLKNLDELHEMIGSYNSSATYFVTRIRALPQDDDSLTIREKIADISDAFMSPLGRMHTKTRIYAPELIKNWNTINDSAHELLDIAIQYSSQKKTFPEVITKQKAINLECKNFFRAIEKKIMNYESGLEKSLK